MEVCPKLCKEVCSEACPDDCLEVSLNVRVPGSSLSERLPGYLSCGLSGTGLEICLEVCLGFKQKH